MQRPTHCRAACERKNDPCPQSCWIMKRRIMKPAVGIASRMVSQYPTSRLRRVAYQSTAKGMAEVSSCRTLAPVSGPQYGLRMAFQRATFLRSGAVGMVWSVRGPGEVG